MGWQLAGLMLVINIRTTGTDSRGYPEQGQGRKPRKVRSDIQVRQNRTKTRAVLLIKEPARPSRKTMGIQLTQEAGACQDPSKRMEVFRPQQEVTKGLVLCKKAVGQRVLQKHAVQRIQIRRKMRF